MSKTKAEKLNSLISNKRSQWLEKANWRERNEAWLDISFAIAVKILTVLRENKKKNLYPTNQKELAEAMGCSPQYINKILKGTENMQLETISRIGSILNVPLIAVPGQNEIKKESVEAATGNVQQVLVSTVTRKKRSARYLIDRSKNYFIQTVEQKGISYSLLKKQVNTEEEFNNDPNSSLKIGA